MKKIQASINVKKKKIFKNYCKFLKSFKILFKLTKIFHKLRKSFKKLKLLTNYKKV